MSILDAEDLAYLASNIRKHESYLLSRLDLIASNAWTSKWSRFAISSVLSNNYCIGLPGERMYGGCHYIDLIEEHVIGLTCDLFKAPYSIVQFLSGMQANSAAYHAFLKPGDRVIAAPCKNGGHYSHTKDGFLRYFDIELIPIPFDARIYNIDLEELSKLIVRSRPKLLILGWSELLFEYQISDIRALCQERNVKIMYDMSHVAGLVAGGCFQSGLCSYVDIVTSSTGKSLHAPDHGVCIFSDSKLKLILQEAVMPILTSNTHPHEIAALGMALLEMREFGKDYACQVVANSKALGLALKNEGVCVLYEELGFTDSHTLLLEHPDALSLVDKLDRAGISVNACALPWNQESQVTGLRIGTQVLTRRGFVEIDMIDVAHAVAQVLVHGKEPESVFMNEVSILAMKHQSTAFSFDSIIL